MLVFKGQIHENILKEEVKKCFKQDICKNAPYIEDSWKKIQYLFFFRHFLFDYDLGCND